MCSEGIPVRGGLHRAILQDLLGMLCRILRRLLRDMKRGSGNGRGTVSIRQRYGWFLPMVLQLGLMGS